MKKKGISLILLVITIIIIIIIAGAVILNLNNNNPANKARLASVEQTRDSLKSGINLYVGNIMAKENGQHKSTTMILGKNDEVTKYKIITGDYEEDYDIVFSDIEIWQLDYEKVKDLVNLKLDIYDSHSSWYIDQYGNPYLVYDKLENVAPFLKDETGNIAMAVRDFVVCLENDVEKCTITYKASDESNALTTSTEVKKKRSISLDTNTFTKPGYTFDGWVDQDNNTYTDGQTNVIPTKDLILTAKWKIIVYTISYTLNGGSVSSNPSVYTVEDNDFTLNNPSKDSYYFTGWTGSNGNTPQKDLVITKGSTGNKTFSANYAQYSQASLRKFNASDSHVSWTFDSSSGIYTITQSARSSGWGDGVVCDDSSTPIEWGKNYMLEFEIKVPTTQTLKTDGNTMFVHNGDGNDIYGTSWLIIDDVRTDGTGYGALPQSSVISGGTWHKVQMYLINDNAGQNPNHYAIKSYSGFALDLSSINSNVTYQMRNLKSIVY